jgi:hypothetical protein
MDSDPITDEALAIEHHDKWGGRYCHTDEDTKSANKSGSCSNGNKTGTAVEHLNP